MLELTENPANLRVLYNTVSPDIDLGSFNEFATRMASVKNRQTFYSQIQPNIDLGDYQTFNEKVSSSYKRPSFWQELKRTGEITAKTIPVATIGSFAERIAIEGGVLKFGEKLLRSTNPFMIPNMIAEEILPKLPDEQKKKFIEAHPFYQWGRKLRKETKKKIQQDPSLQRPAGYREWTFGNMVALDKLGETIGNVVPSVLISTGIGVGVAAVTKSPIAGLGAAATVAYGMESGFAYDDAIEYGLEPEEASRVANTVGVINAVLEILPVGRAISKMKIGKQVQKSLAEKLIAKGAYKEIPKEMFKQAVTEGATETLQELNSIVQESRYKGKIPSWLEIGSRATQAGFGGFIGGGGVGVVSGVVQQQKARQIIPRIKEQQITDIGYLEKLAPTAKGFKPTLKKPEIITKEELPFVDTFQKTPKTAREKFQQIQDTQTRIDKELAKPTLQFKEENPLVRKRTNTLIKEKIKYLKRGERLSELDTRKALTDLKMLIIDKAKTDLPKDSMTRGQVKPLMTQIAKAKNITDVENALERIDTISETVERKKGLQKIDKILKRVEPKRVGGKLVGTTLPAEYYQRLGNVNRILKSTPETIDAEITKLQEQSLNKDGEVSEEIANKIYMLQTFGDLKGKTVEGINRAVDDLESFIKTGKSLRIAEKEAIKKVNKKTIQSDLDVIIGEKGAAPLHPVEFQGSVLNKFKQMSMFNPNMGQSLEWLLDILSKRHKESAPLQSPINLRITPKIHQARKTSNDIHYMYIKQSHGKLKEIFGLTDRKLAKTLFENSQPQNTGIMLVGKEGTSKEGVSTELKISKNQAYKKWMEWQSPEVRERLENDVYIWDERVMAQIEDYVGDELLEWAQYQLTEIYPQIYEQINEVYKKLNNIDLPYNAFYSPLSAEIDEKTRTSSDIVPLFQGNGINASVGNHHLLPRTSDQITKFRDGDSVLSQYITEMSHYIGWGEPIQHIRTTLLSPTVKKAIRQYHGSGVEKILKDHINHLANNGIDKATVHATLDKMRQKFVTAVLGINPVVFMKQLMSFPAYMMEADITPKVFTEGLLDFAKNPLKAINTLKQSTMLRERYRVGFERDIMFAMKGTTPKTLSETKNIADTLLFFTKLGDRAAIYLGGWSVYKYNYDKSRKSGMTHEQANKKALYEFDITTERAQQAGNPEHLGAIQRMGSWARLFTMFITAQNQYFRSVNSGIRNIRAGRGGKIKNIKRMVIGHSLLPMMFQFAASGFRWENEDQIRAFILGSLNGWLIAAKFLEPLAENIISFSKYGIDGTPISTGWNKISDTMGRFAKSFDDGFKLEDIFEVMHGLASGLSKTHAPIIGGVPYDPLYRISKGFTDLAKGELKDLRQLLGYSEYALGIDRKSSKKKGGSKRKERRRR